MPETEENKPSEEPGKHSKKEKTLLWWGLGLAGAGLLATLFLFKNNQGGSTAVQQPAVIGPGAAVPGSYNAGGGVQQAFIPNPQNPYNASANEYWPVPSTTPTPTDTTACPSTGCVVTPNQTTLPASSTPTSSTPVATQQQADTSGQQQQAQSSGDTSQSQQAPAINWATFGGAPAPMGTPGMSNNFWTYWTQQGDTLTSLATKFNWQNQGGANQVLNYRNNAPIFAAKGVTGFNQPIPAGTLISA